MVRGVLIRNSAVYPGDCTAAGWVGLGAPANTAPEIIAILNRQVNAAMAAPWLGQRIAILVN